VAAAAVFLRSTAILIIRAKPGPDANYRRAEAKTRKTRKIGKPLSAGFVRRPGPRNSADRVALRLRRPELVTLFGPEFPSA
jgi:hypothetical protein